ncbi:MAG TPA: hypothetical protein V6D20_25335 [Candidatus Obscuribacterales bacterium]
MADLKITVDSTEVKTAQDRITRLQATLSRAGSTYATAARSTQSYSAAASSAANSIQRQAVQTQRLNTVTNQYVTGVNRATLQTKRFGAAGLQQVGYQVGDFAVQIQGGTNALVALGQQGSQLLGIFGAWGAVAGAGLAIGTALANTFLSLGMGADDATKSVDKLSESTDRLRGFNDLARSSAEDLRMEYGRTADELERLIGLQQRQGTRQVEVTRRSSVENLAGEIGGLVADVERQIEIIEIAEKNILEYGNSSEAAYIQLRVAARDSANIARQVLDDLAKQMDTNSETLVDLIAKYRQFEEASTLEETEKAALDLAEALESIDAIKFDSIISALNSLTDTAIQAANEVNKASTANAIRVSGTRGRGEAGPGGPLAGSADAQLLAQLGYVPSGDEPETTPSRRGRSGSAAKVKDLREEYERLMGALDPLYAANQKYLEQEKFLGEALAAGKINATEYSTALGLVTEQFQKATAGPIQQYRAELERLQDFDATIAEGAKSLQSAFADFLFDPFESGVQGMVLQFADAIRRMMAEAIAARAVNALLGAFGLGGPTAIPGITPNANGNAFMGGNVIPFANGGVVSSPVMFPMAKGMGLMGEAGPEAIMPLTRGSDGKLGVKSNGNQQQGTSVAVVIVDDERDAEKYKNDPRYQQVEVKRLKKLGVAFNG